MWPSYAWVCYNLCVLLRRFLCFLADNCRPAGSSEVYYTESETDDKMSGTDSVTTVESTHPGMPTSI